MRSEINRKFFETGDVKNLFDDDFIKKYGKADVLITDPQEVECIQMLLNRF